MKNNKYLLGIVLVLIVAISAILLRNQYQSVGSISDTSVVKMNDTKWTSYADNALRISFDYPSNEVQIVPAGTSETASSSLRLDNGYHPSGAKSITSESAVIDPTKIHSLEEWVIQVEGSRRNDQGAPVKTETRYETVDGVKIAISNIPADTGTGKGYTEIKFFRNGEYRWFTISNLSSTTTERIVKSLHFN